MGPAGRLALDRLAASATPGCRRRRRELPGATRRRKVPASAHPLLSPAAVAQPAGAPASASAYRIEDPVNRGLGHLDDGPEFKGPCDSPRDRPAEQHAIRLSLNLNDANRIRQDHQDDPSTNAGKPNPEHRLAPQTALGFRLISTWDRLIINTERASPGEWIPHTTPSRQAIFGLVLDHAQTNEEPTTERGNEPGDLQVAVLCGSRECNQHHEHDGDGSSQRHFAHLPFVIRSDPPPTPPG